MMNMTSKSCSLGDLVASVYDEASRLAPSDEAVRNELAAQVLAKLLARSRRLDIMRRLAAAAI